MNEITSLARIVAVDNAKTALRYFLDRSGGKPTSQIHGLAILLKTIAKHWVQVDKAHLDDLKALCKRVDPQQKGLTDKNRKRLRQLDDPHNVDLLLNFPVQQLEEVRLRDNGRRGEAVSVQIALSVEILLMAPIRAANLVNIEIDRHIVRTRTGRSGKVHLVIPGEEVKNGEPLEFELPAETVALLDTYLREYHPRLTEAPSLWLFPGKNGGAKTRELLGQQISERVFKATGLQVTTGEREIDENQATVISRIFQEYADGMAPRLIATRLNAEGIPGPRGGPWNASTINGSRQRRNGILNNQLYLGRITYNRQRFVKDPETGKRVSRPNPEHEWVTTAVPHLRIVDDETWDQVQAIKARYATQSGNRRQTKKRLLTGFVKCGCCGGSMTIINRERYYCSAKRERGTCESTVGIGAAELESRVLDGLRDILLGQEDLIEEFVAEFKAEINRLRKQGTTRERQDQKELNKVNNAITRCLNFIKEGDGDPGLVRNELRDLEISKRNL